MDIKVGGSGLEETLSVLSGQLISQLLPVRANRAVSAKSACIIILEPSVLTATVGTLGEKL